MTYVNSFGNTTGDQPTIVINGGILNQNAVSSNGGPDSHIQSVILTGGTMAGTANGSPGGTFDPTGGAITTLASSATSVISAILKLYDPAIFNVAAGTAPDGLDLLVSEGAISRNAAYGVTKTGNGLMQLTAANTYTGGTTITAGTLQLGSGSATLGTNTGSLTVTAGLLDLNGYSVGVGALSGAGTIDNVAGGGTSVLTVGNGNATGATFAGTIQNSSGVVSLVKTGTGTLTLTGSNTYSGGTTITGSGILAIGGGLDAANENVNFPRFADRSRSPATPYCSWRQPRRNEILHHCQQHYDQQRHCVRAGWFPGSQRR